MTYVACVGVPGYLPMLCEGGFATISDAWQFLADERERDVESNARIEQDQTWVDLVLRVGAQGPAECGSVHGPDPNGGTHDLGFVYEVLPEEEV